MEAIFSFDIRIEWNRDLVKKKKIVFHFVIVPDGNF